MTSLEQLAMGVPMIMSDIGGGAEIVEDGTNGYLFEAGDTDGLVDCLTRLYDSEWRQGMRRAAWPSVERYTTARMIAAYEQLALDLARRDCCSRILMRLAPDGRPLVEVSSLIPSP